MAGAIQHVYARGNDRQVIYRDDLDRRRYLAMLGSVVALKDWRCLAYCLMDNHAHLLIETPQPNLASGMQRLHGRYALFHNARYDRVGHLFQGRYGSVRMRSDAQLWTVARYIARNPVKAGFCEHPDEWPWSSHAATLGSGAPPWLDVGRLLSYIDSGGDPTERYAELASSD